LEFFRHVVPGSRFLAPSRTYFETFGSTACIGSPGGVPPLKSKKDNIKPEGDMKETIELQVEELEERIAPSNANFPPGQFPSGNPAHAPGQSNPNEVPANNPGKD
jgi:hypothetical protein